MRLLVGAALGASTVALAASTVVTLRESVRIEGLPALAQTPLLGLGRDAREASLWMDAHPGPHRLDADRALLSSADGSTRRLRGDLALAMGRLNQWFSLVASPARPITPMELEGAALAPAAVDRIARLFDAAIDRGIRVGDQWITPEVGGEAVIDGILLLAEAEDPRWETVRQLSAASTKGADTLAGFIETETARVTAVDTHGLLRGAVGRYRRQFKGSADEMRRAVLTVARNTAAAFVHEPDAQLALVVSREWQGRYVGRWHTHPPHDAGNRWEAGDVPSFEDMTNAVEAGQYLTLAFDPEGFTLYDAAALADLGRVDLSRVRAIRYRSPAWKSRFEARRSLRR